MISVVSTNITSPLGFTTEENYQAVLSGCSALKRYEGKWGLPEPFCASLFDDNQRASLAIEGYTFFEAIAIRSIRTALTYTTLGNSLSRVILILSTTKGNIEALGEELYYPSKAAQRIAEAIGLTTKPIVVQNACVSGLSAQLLADRLLSAGFYDYAIVVGAEVQGPFIVSGFQSLKAVSDEPCRPFDMERNGLNPGEAAATIIYTSTRTGRHDAWHLVGGAARNDAYHNVTPQPQGEGLLLAINAAMEGKDKSRLATVQAHGTATLFGDQMESVAINRAGLSDVPLSALKGYYGHTMGAAGVLESILAMRATDDGIVIPVKGFAELGVSGRISISSKLQKTDKSAFLKAMSGFGGCNVALLYEASPQSSSTKKEERHRKKVHTVRLSSEDETSLTDIYKQEIGNYPKFHKMDILSRLAFVAAEKTLSDSKTLSNSPLKGENTGEDSLPLREGWGGSLEVWRGSVILFGHSSSIVADKQYLSTISDAGNFFPSPSLFTYSLPNIAASEIAIRHHLHGETCFYILPEKDEALMQEIVDATHSATGAQTAIFGWIDAESETQYECEMKVTL